MSPAEQDELRIVRGWLDRLARDRMSGWDERDDDYYRRLLGRERDLLALRDDATSGVVLQDRLL